MQTIIKRALPKAKALAVEFVRLLEQEIGKEKLLEVARRNRAEPDSNCCHSHDFTDANEIMDEAFSNVAGYKATDTGGGSDALQSGGCVADRVLPVWDKAWQLAIERTAHPLFEWVTVYGATDSLGGGMSFPLKRGQVVTASEPLKVNQYVKKGERLTFAGFSAYSVLFTIGQRPASPLERWNWVRLESSQLLLLSV